MENLKNISKDIWDKAFLFTDLDARLHWALNEKNDLECIHELAENPNVNLHKIKTVGEFTGIGFVEKEVNSPKPFKETLSYKAIFNLPNGPKRPRSYDKVEILTDVINHTYDKIYFRNEVVNKLTEFSNDIEKDMFLIDCKSDEELIFNLKYWGRDSWRKVINNFIEERKTGIKSTKEFIGKKKGLNQLDKVYLLNKIGFFTMLKQKHLNVKQIAEITSIILGNSIKENEKLIPGQDYIKSSRYRSDKTHDKVKAILSVYPLPFEK